MQKLWNPQSEIYEKYDSNVWGPNPHERTRELNTDERTCEMHLKLSSIEARVSFLVAHFRPEIGYWLVKKIRSISPQKPAIMQLHDQEQLKLYLHDCPLRLHLKMTSQYHLNEWSQVVFLT